MAELKPYAAYKDSGVPWLGQVPEQWRVDRPKWLFQKMDRPVRENDNIVTCFRDGTVTLRKNRRTSGFTTALKEIGYQGIRRGDLVIHAMDAFAGAVGVSDSDGKGSPVYSVCEALPNANAGYYAYIIREMARSQWILALATGIRERSTDFRYGDFSCQSVPVPPLSEQAAIVRYLDHVDRKVRHVIRARQQLIKLLTEQKQAIIQRAVTRGLDPNVRLTPSGVPWLGDVPKHWEVQRLSASIANFVSGAWGTDPNGTDDTICVRVADFDRSHLRVRIDRPTLRAIPPAELRRKRLSRGDLLLEKSGGGDLQPVGVVMLYDQGEVAVCSNFVARMSVATGFEPAFLVYLHATLYSIGLNVRSIKQTTGIQNLDCRAYLSESVAFPPLREQSDIVRYLDGATANLDNAIDAAHREIGLLREYRTRLIADVVTGKLDVRDVPVPADETDILPEGLEDIDDVDAADQGNDAVEADSGAEESA